MTTSCYFKRPRPTSEDLGGVTWIKDPKEYSRRRNRFDRYGLTHSRYLSLLESQHGSCATCGRPEYEDGKPLHVDHDHACCPGSTSCGKCTRGLLCEKCNHAEGRLQSSPEVAFAMAVYLTPKPIGTLFVMKDIS